MTRSGWTSGSGLRKSAEFESELLPATPAPHNAPGLRYEDPLQVFRLDVTADVTLRNWGLWPEIHSR